MSQLDITPVIVRGGVNTSSSRAGMPPASRVRACSSPPSLCRDYPRFALGHEETSQVALSIVKTTKRTIDRRCP